MRNLTIKAEILNNLCKNLCEIRSKKWISTDILAEVIGKSTRTIVYACKGATLLSMTDIYRISCVCRISIESLLLTTLSENEIEAAARNIHTEYLNLMQGKTFYDREKTKEALLATLRQNLLLHSDTKKDKSVIDGITTHEAYRKAYERTVNFKSKNISNAVNIYLIAHSYYLTMDELCQRK